MTWEERFNELEDYENPASYATCVLDLDESDGVIAAVAAALVNLVDTARERRPRASAEETVEHALLLMLRDKDLMKRLHAEKKTFVPADRDKMTLAYAATQARLQKGV